MKTNQESGNICSGQVDYCIPLVDSMKQDSQFFPLYQSLVCDPISAKTSINKADSGLTYNMNIPVSATRKRPRDSFINGFDSYTVSQKNKLSGISSVLDDDAFSQIQQQQEEIERFIAEHVSFLTKKNPTFPNTVVSIREKNNLFFPLMLTWQFNDMNSFLFCIDYRQRK